jgi:hypothetical protein
MEHGVLARSGGERFIQKTQVSIQTAAGSNRAKQTEGKNRPFAPKSPVFAMKAKLISPRGWFRVTKLLQRRLSLQSKLAKAGELIEF